MKNIIFKTLFMSILLALCVSCAGDDDGANTNGDETFLFAKVDGVDFEVKELIYATSITMGEIKTTLMGASYVDESRTISMSLANVDGPGTYHLFDQSIHDPQTSAYVSSMVYGNGTTGWYAIDQLADVSATVTIVDYSSSYIMGTFNFTGLDLDSETRKNITEGAFMFKRLKVN